MKSLKIISFVFFSLVSVRVCSQLAETNQSKLIVEGEVTSVTSKWNEDRTHIITESFVKVKAVFKGELRDSVIRIETIGGEVGGNFHYRPHTIQLNEGYQGYFFLDDSYEFISYLGGFAHISDDLNKKVRHRGEVLSQRSFEQEIIKTTKFPKITTSEYFTLYKDKGKRNIDTCNIILSLRENKSIDFSFKNVQYSGDLQYIEFDINAKVNTPGLKFGEGSLYIKYSPHFGTNVITENTLEITKGTILQDSIYNITITDFNAQTIKISVHPAYGSNSLYTFSESEEPLVHVKLKITDFSSIGSISFDDIDIAGEVFYWCQGAYGLFDETNLSEPIKAISGTQVNAIGIIYTFENPTYSALGNQFSVDLFAQATATSKYSDGYLYINYNELGFGSDVITNGALSFQQQDLIGDTNVYKVYKEDFNQNTFSLLIYNLSYDPNHYSELGTTPRKLGRLIFNVINCAENKNLHFDQITVTSIHSHFTGILPFPWEYYSPVIADDEETGSICDCKKPKITSFSPQSIHGGVGEILTITGQDFGTFTSSSTVLFKNGDATGPSEIEAGINDLNWDNVIHWTDTEIKIKVPGCDKFKGSSRPPSTGKFRIKNRCEVSEESGTKLDIPYSIFNYRGTVNGEVTRIGLQPNTICFSFSNQVPFWVRQQFVIAVSDWCSQTGISFKIGPTITKNTPSGALDNINLVSFESGSGGGMLSSSFYFESSNCFSEIDFVVQTTLTSPTTADEENMRELIKHELGHAHMLNHAKGFGQLMHPSGNAGGNITTNDKDGANLIFAASTVCGGIGKGGCGGTCTVSTHEENPANIQISPNPASIILNLISNEESIYQVDIINNQGITLKTFINLKAENELNISDIPAGSYICRITTKAGISNKMFIKI